MANKLDAIDYFLLSVAFLSLILALIIIIYV